MDKLQKYIIHNLSIIFLSIFLPLFAIASVIFLIKLATYTAVIQLSIWEMTKLYIFVLPELLFYTLPITFFIATTLSLFQLSNDNEIVVIKRVVRQALIVCIKVLLGVHQGKIALQSHYHLRVERVIV